MIIGLGMDLIEVSRFETELRDRGDGLIEEVLLPSEIAYCRDKRRACPYYAARFAAKEALFKALGTGMTGGMSWHDAEVLRDGKGRPSLALTGETLKVAGEMGVRKVSVSLTHSDEYAAAVVTLED